MHHQPLRARTRSWTRSPLGLVVICLPAVLLLISLVGVPAQGQSMIRVGCLFQLVATGIALLNRQNRRDPATWPVIMLYVISFAWLQFVGASNFSLTPLLIQGALLGGAMLLFARLCLRESGALARRRAQKLVDRLSRRKSWPTDLVQVRQLAEVHALAESVGPDPSPVFALVVHPRLEVRMAGLAALEYRTQWLPGQPKYLLNLLQNAQEPEIKSATILALACVEDRPILEALCEYLWDPEPQVRQAAVSALLWYTEVRWQWIRIAIRQSLAHPVSSQDGSLILPGTVLGAEVILDLVSWTAEKGILAQRAAVTLGVHYNHLLHQGADASLVRELEQQLVNPQTPAFWRLEIARLLGQYREVTLDVARTLLHPTHPASLRLLAIETLLGKAQHNEAVAALVEIARLPNREMAMAAAEIVQRRLNVDLGLRNGQGLPPTHTRQAAEIVRNVLLWADRQDGTWNRVPAGRSYDDDY